MDFSDIIIYRRVVAIAVVVVAIWIGWLFWRLAREKVIFKADFYRAHWKIGLFWFVVIAFAIAAWVYLQE